MSIRVVAAAIEEAGQILCALRPHGHRHAGKWELPGGKVEPGESDAQALARELKEELDVEVVVCACIGTSRHDEGDRVIELVGYRCELYAGRPEPIEHAELRWVVPERLSELDWSPADRALVAALIG